MSDTDRLQGLSEALPLHLLQVQLLVRRRVLAGQEPHEEVQALIERATELLGHLVALERRMGG